jgi:hypothetical protein
MIGKQHLPVFLAMAAYKLSHILTILPAPTIINVRSRLTNVSEIV